MFVIINVNVTVIECCKFEILSDIYFFMLGFYLFIGWEMTSNVFLCHSKSITFYIFVKVSHPAFIHIYMKVLYKESITYLEHKLSPVPTGKASSGHREMLMSAIIYSHQGIMIPGIKIYQQLPLVTIMANILH